jgi:hypothetical protein
VLKRNPWRKRKVAALKMLLEEQSVPADNQADMAVNIRHGEWKTGGIEL